MNIWGNNMINKAENIYDLLDFLGVYDLLDDN